MIKMFSKRTKNQKGFTLVELIVVVAILGILAAVAIPRYTGMRQNANEGAVVANLRTIQNGAEVFAAGKNVDIKDTSVTKEEIEKILGSWPTGPSGAVYDWDSTNGEAIVSTAPSVYPDQGIMKYTDID